jgi:hypothetical protein
MSGNSSGAASGCIDIATAFSLRSAEIPQQIARCVVSHDVAAVAFDRIRAGMQLKDRRIANLPNAQCPPVRHDKLQTLSPGFYGGATAQESEPA